MNVLLDTHTFLWAIFEHNKLSKKVCSIILDTNNIIYVSIITFWEISLKYNIGKILLKNVQPDELPSYAIKSGFEILNFVVTKRIKLPIINHKEIPFDRSILLAEHKFQTNFIIERYENR